jgi:hypothetical protein
METMSHTFGNAGWHEAIINPVHAVVALYYLAGLIIPLWSTPRAGPHAGLAPYAELVIGEDNAVLCPLLHGPSWASSHAPGSFAVVAGHEDEVHFGNIVYHLGSHRLDAAKPGPHWQPFILFTMNFARQAGDALGAVMEKIVLAHYFSP